MFFLQTLEIDILLGEERLDCMRCDKSLRETIIKLLMSKLMAAAIISFTKTLICEAEILCILDPLQSTSSIPL